MKWKVIDVLYLILVFIMMFKLGNRLFTEQYGALQGGLELVVTVLWIIMGRLCIDIIKSFFQP